MLLVPGKLIDGLHTTGPGLIGKILSQTQVRSAVQSETHNAVPASMMFTLGLCCYLFRVFHKLIGCSHQQCTTEPGRGFLH
jgi:hypothetical protein